MAISSATNAIIQTKVEDIKNLIKHSDKDSALRSQLEEQFEDILEEHEKLCGTRVTIVNAASVRKQIEEFKTALDTFRRWVIKQISKSEVIRTPKVTVQKIDIVKKARKESLEDENDEDFSDSESDDYDDLFIPIKIRKDKTNDENSPTLSGKRIRKEVIRPDFINTFKKPKTSSGGWVGKMEDDESMHDNSGDGESSHFRTPSRSNGLGPEFPCPVCRKIFRKKGHMTRHLLTHEPEKPFGCDFCSKRFAAKYSLQMHLLNRHNTDAKPFECEKCQRRFTLKKELDQHAQTHKEGFKPKVYQCTNCELKFINQADLDSHLEQTHPEESFNCGQCDKTFPRKYNLIRHERTHSADKSQYFCSVCKKEFGTKSGLQMHLQAHEIESKNKQLSCEFCGKNFAVKQNLEIHIDFHNQSDDKPYSCSLCEVRFKSQERLEKHIDTHGSSEGRVYPCQYCEKTFPRKYNLIRHELSHTHGRRKPKEGMPTPIPRILEQRERDKELRQERHATNGYSNGGTSSTDDEACNESVPQSNTTYVTEGHQIVTVEEPLQNVINYGYVYRCVKSEMCSSLFAFEEDSSDGISPFSKQRYRVLKFENY